MQRKKQKENWFMHISLIAAMIHHDCAAASFSLRTVFSLFYVFSVFFTAPTAAHHNRDTVLNPEYSVLLTFDCGT